MKRWDNAPHHPEISTYPHYLHDGFEDSVFPYLPVDIEEILRQISEHIKSQLS
ncbi:toxin-antitoxin system TumE family protein [Aphanizomenon flos-aquae]|uniref:toxin-antitoxin system TumE family protein n=1 Tax=Aphanizomenon flos-aquae TaxID=1176 RepID=UPI0030B809DB